MTLNHALRLLAMLTGPAVRFAKYVPAKPDENGCWMWQGYVGARGYGQFQKASRTTVYAHRFIYEALVGAVPDGLVLDHTCHNDTDCTGGWDCSHRACVNPAHLEAVTPAENQRRSGGGFRARKLQTECVRGHELAGYNLIVRATGHRQCRECRNLHTANWRAKKKVAA